MLIVGVAGGTGSGKTTVVNKVMERLPKEDVIVVRGTGRALKCRYHNTRRRRESGGY